MSNDRKTGDESTNMEVPVITWNKNQILKWIDFKKESEPKVNAAAVSAIGFKSKPLIEHIKTGSKFKFKIRDIELYAIFIPNFSWVRKNISWKKRALLLEHEQGHFDLAEEVTRKTRIEMINHFQDRVFDIKETDEDGAKKEAELHANNIRKEMERKLQSELEIQETKYDKKTNHGLITEHQNKYNKRFKKLRE